MKNWQLIKAEIKDDPRAYRGYQSRIGLARSHHIHYYEFSRMFTQIIHDDPELVTKTLKFMGAKYDVAVGKIRECKRNRQDNNKLLKAWRRAA